MKKQTDDNMLQKYRMMIDEVDHQIIDLLQMRFDVVTEIGKVKQRKGIPILDAAREQQKLEALTSLCAEEKRAYVAEILKKIMEESRHYQKDHPMRYGLLGRVLGHSHSPQIHKMLGGYRYGLFEREPEQLDDFFSDDAWRGISVTMPYKRDVMKYCDEISPQAMDCNSVNTIVRRADGSLFGTNTDYFGFRDTVERSGIDVKGRKALVLGSGGVSGTVVRVLEDLGAAPVVIVSRSGEDNYENLERHADAQILVNATPVGMFPKAGAAPVDIRRLPDLKAVYDLIYNPLRTKLMLDTEAAGIPAFGGLYMLVAQAAKAVELFAREANAVEPDVRIARAVETFTWGVKAEETSAREAGDIPYVPAGVSREEWIAQACRSLRQELEHIVLIGMPGAGKSTVGQALAQKIRGQFMDMDGAIAVRMGQTPEQIIRERGIDYFRSIETRMLEMILRNRQGRLIIATGGGCVEREVNRDLLRENGRVIWLKRPIGELPVDGRPVSQSDGLEEILRRRLPAYQSWSDIEVDCTDVDETVNAIIKHLDQ